MDFIKSVNNPAAIVKTPTELEVMEPMNSIAVKNVKKIMIFVKLFLIISLW